ncbi:hypothetical protein BGX20_007311 [Mortierella sp. AD010]|nr:hypothetical protein BGX20_007311 [Mortierella sp. AD010]
MYIIQEHELKNIASLRNPSRNNRFSILAKASLGDQLVLLQQSRLDRDRTNGWDMEEWLETLSSKAQASHESHLLRVWGVLARPLPPSIAPTPLAGSFASSFNSERPIYVVKFCERGSLRDCIDRGEFLSDWSAKIAILKNVATALHYIKCNLYGQQHGSVSSSAVYLDKDGHALLTWHRVKGSSRDFASGLCQDWRWFPPTVIQQLQRKLSDGGADPSALLELEYDDIYSFGILAWEVATEELPFETVHLPHDLGQSKIGAEARFLKKPPYILRNLIRQCTLLDKDKRPSWCDILKQLNGMSEAAFEAVGSFESSDGEQPAVVSNEVPLLEPVPLNEDKSNVVVMMESALTSTFYRKELPGHLVSITSATGRRLFREMMLAGTSECFFSLFTSFNTQSDPAFCGVSSLSMVLNALEIDPRRQWRGVWRWYSEEHLDCCASVEVMKQKGITFNQFRCLAKCHAEVVAKPAELHSVEEFRRDIQAITSSEGSHMVLSFSRAALGQTGSGHFSPIGGYHAEEDKVLVLDCARFKYPPFYATVQELWESLLPTDPETGKCRGYFLITTTARQRLDIQKRRLHALMKEGETGATLSSSTLSAASSAYSSIESSRSTSPMLRQGCNRRSLPSIDLRTTQDESAECDCSCSMKTLQK